MDNYKLLEAVHKIANDINSQMCADKVIPGEAEECLFWAVVVKTHITDNYMTIGVEFTDIPIWCSENDSQYEFSDDPDGSFDTEYKSLKEHIEGQIIKYVGELASFKFFDSVKE